MLPLLPALLLLIFRGPTPDCRMALDDCRSGAGRVEVNAERKAELSKARHVAALLALSRNPAFSRTVAELLRSLPADAAETNTDLVAAPFVCSIVSIPAPPLARLHAGFSNAQRTRDGPILL